MANDSFAQGLLQNLLAPQQQRMSPQDIMAAMSSPNPMAAVMAASVPQTTQAIGQGIRGMIGGITGKKLLTGTEALQQGLANIDTSTSAGLLKAAELARKTGRTAEAVQLVTAAGELKKQEEAQALQKQRDEAALEYQTKLTQQLEANMARAVREENRAVEAEVWNQKLKEGQLALQNRQMANAEEQTRINMLNAETAIANKKYANDSLSAAEAERLNALDAKISENLLFAGRAASVAERYEALQPVAGVAGKGWEAVKSIFGTEDDITALENDFEGLKAQFTISNLPKGAASDKDIVFAMKGWPDANYNAEQVAAFMRGQAKMAMLLAGQSQMQSDYMVRNLENNSFGGTSIGWREEWNALLEDKDAFTNFMTKSFGSAYQFVEDDGQGYGDIDYSSLIGGDQQGGGQSRRRGR